MAAKDPSLMDNPSVAHSPEPAIDYANAAGDVVDPVRPEGTLGDLTSEPQQETFRGFMSVSRYAGAAIVLIVFWATLLFALGASGWPAALSTLGLGLLLAPALKLRGAYVPLLVLSCLVLGVGTWIFAGSPDIPAPSEVQVENTAG